jgi:hypothetical protein
MGAPWLVSTTVAGGGTIRVVVTTRRTRDAGRLTVVVRRTTRLVCT